MVEKGLPSTKPVFNYSARLQDPRYAVMLRFLKEKRIIEVLSFKMPLNDDAINNLRDVNTSIVYERQRIDMG
jgi:hypothetical protein